MKLGDFMRDELPLYKKIVTALQKQVEWPTARKIEIDSLETICLAVGPYRNLTTLTASILFLHPNCQVLNHAGRRIFDDRRFDFIQSFSSRKLDNFAKYSIYMSRAGRRGDAGGSITHSHAFRTHDDMKKMYEESGGKPIKDDIRALFWKESLRTSIRIRQFNVDFDKIFFGDSRLKFLLPIRHPLDCAVSNKKTGHADLFPGISSDSPLPQVVTAILEEFQWFAKLQAQFPYRFFHYFEHSFNRQMLTDMAEFLRLEPDEEWIENAQAAFKIKKHYDHSPELIAHYHAEVNRLFGEFPDFAEQLAIFVE